MASTLTRINNSRPNSNNDNNNKPKYKDYVNFLDAYNKFNKKDDESSIDSGISIKSYPLTNSNNTSNSSLSSMDQTDFSKSGSCTSFSNYLENLQNKKYCPVKPKLNSSSGGNGIEETDKKPLMKSEIFIEVSSPKREIVKTISLPQDNNNKMVINNNNNNSNNNKPAIASKAQLFEKINTQLKNNNLKKSESFKGANTSIKKNLEKFENRQTPERPIQKIQIPAALQQLEISKINNNQERPSVPIKNELIVEKNNPPNATNENVVEKINPQNVNSRNEKPPALVTNVPPPPPPPMIDLNKPMPKLANYSKKPTITSSNKPTMASVNNGHQNILAKNQINQKLPETTKINTNNNEAPKLDKNDPRVRKLVYGTLRGMYGAYHEKANDFVATLPRNMVRKDNGIQNIINVIAQQQSRLPGAGLGLNNTTFGHIPKVKYLTNNTKKMDPPQCVQNAMMKQTKKPFTYTPGGIDLSEIKSPRMQRRIERNAHFPGVNEIPQGPLPSQQPTGPLPPSALAAMQPQLQVQVLPSGIPPPPGRMAPPPPPPPANIPPPPPLQPLPTQKVCVNNEVLERPDMTKIIPENPMALLKKTGGPKPRKSFVEEMMNVKPQQYSPPVQEQQQQQQQQQQYQQPVQAPAAQQWNQPQVQTNESQSRWPQHQQSQSQQPQQRWSQPPIQAEPQQRWAPSPQPQKEPQSQQRWAPQSQVQNEPIWGANGTATPNQNQTQNTWSPPVQKQTSPSAPTQPQWSPPIIERQPEKPVKTSTANIGSLYIPPMNQQQQQQQQQKITTPPTPPKRDTQSPIIQSPTLKEAPRPWQRQTTPQQELPPWAKRDTPETVVVQQKPSETSPDPQKHPNAVYITQPVVLQHPGPPPSHKGQSPKVDAQGARVVPVKVENGQRQTQPMSPNTNERYSRQGSWGNTPTQSNAFKIIQKITNTDGDDVDENEPIVEHPPKYPQHFQQGPLVDQIRRMQMAEGDANLMNKFKQVEEDPRYRGGYIPSRIFRVLDESGVDEENYLHNEVDPRYRGAAIPSKAFKLLQSMTDGSDTSTVPRGGAPAKQPQVRTIPIQIERDDQEAKPYVHPSQQTVPEPKKYTGSSIPSRSFKILQAMTAADSCANANEVNENYDPYQWGCYEPYPILCQPYPPFYYTDNNNDNNTQLNNNSNKAESSCKNSRFTENNSNRKTPLPWSYCPSPFEGQNDENPRKTPLMWGYYPYPILPPPPPPVISAKRDENPVVDNGGGRITPVPIVYYPCYFVPPQAQENYYPYPQPWDPNGYYDQNRSEMDQTVDNTKNIKKQNDHSNAKGQINKEEEEEEKNEETRNKSFNSLKAIKSVTDIRVYDNSDDEDEEQTDEMSEKNEEEEDEDQTEETEDLDSMPNQLSIIYEESEKTDSKRPVSAMSDTTTVQDEVDEEEEEEEDDDDNSVTVSIKLGNRISFNVEEECSEIYTSFTLKSPSTTPKKDRSMCRLEDVNDDDNQENISVIQSDNCQIKCKQTLEKQQTEIQINQKEKHEDKEEEEEEEEEDWWSILKKDDDDFVYKRNAKTETYKNDLNKQIQAIEIEDNEEESGNETETNTVDYKENKEENIEYTKEENDNGIKLGVNSEPYRRYREKINSTLNIEETKEQFYEMQCSVTNIKAEDSIREKSINRENNNGNIEENYIETTTKNMYLKFDSNSSNQKGSNGDDGATKKTWRRNSVKESVLVLEGIFQESNNNNNNLQQIRRQSNATIIKKSLRKDLDFNKSEEADDDTSSASSSDSSSSESSVSKKEAISSVEDNGFNNPNNNKENIEKVEEKQPLTVKERIEALRARIQERQMRLKQKQDDDINVSVQNKITVFEKTSNKSSFKSMEEYSEEEGDSGVTSDMSRHISDEEFPELRKMNRYQRAATHSRLFKLLQEEEGEDDEKDNAIKERTECRREQLTLPLNSDDSLSSSGLVSPVPHVNEKLVSELVQSMLKRRKGEIFNDLPINKLEAAARKVLVENIEVDQISEDSFLSPLGSTPAQTPQEFYNFSDYKPYYDSWNIRDKNDILPSKTFRLLQEQNSNKMSVKCPKIPSILNNNYPNSSFNHQQRSSNQIQQKGPSPENSINEVTNTS